jgi:predicted DNA-binding protein YlxM (UPF0122 family)
MDDITKTGGESSEVPVVETLDASQSEQIGEIEATGDELTPAGTEDTTSVKFDFKTILTPEQYAEFNKIQQRSISKAIKKQGEKTRQLEDKAKVLDDLLRDDEIYNRIQNRYDPSAQASSVTQPQEEDPYQYVDPVVKNKIFEHDIALQGFRLEKALVDIENFKVSLGAEKAKRFDELELEISEIVKSMSSSKLSSRKKLGIAFSYLTKEDVFNEGRKSAVAEFQKKKAVVSPETTSSANEVTVGGAKGWDAAVRAAHRILGIRE